MTVASNASPPPRPVPLPTAVSQPFWEAAAEGRLLLQHCPVCERYLHYPRAACPTCLSEELEWSEVEPKGVIYSYTVVWRAPSPAFAEVPYVLALVDLEVGVRLIGMVAVEPAEVAIGAAVAVNFEGRGELAVPIFRLAGSA